MWLLVDLDKCIGCHACEVGCQQWHQVPPDRKRIRVQTLGPVKRGEQLTTVYYPEVTEYCDLCAANGDGTLFCVETCPVRALQACDAQGTVALLGAGQRYQICRRG